LLFGLGDLIFAEEIGEKGSTSAIIFPGELIATFGSGIGASGVDITFVACDENGGNWTIVFRAIGRIFVVDNSGVLNTENK
jgi:hypothetical protein